MRIWRMPGIPTRSQISRGTCVSIETKIDQGTGRFTVGIIAEILTPGESHPHGIKVRLKDGHVGRVKNIQENTHKLA